MAILGRIRLKATTQGYSVIFIASDIWSALSRLEDTGEQVASFIDSRFAIQHFN